MAAMDGFLRWHNGYDELAAALVEHYMFAIATLQGVSPGGDDGELARRLATHMMGFYWRGVFPYSEGSPVHAFFEKLPPFARSYALSIAGTTLQEFEEKTLPADVKHRLQVLWDSRLSASGLGHAEELQGLAFWIPSNALEPRWLLPRMKELAEALEGNFAFPNQILAKLSSLSLEFPVESMQVLDAMVRRTNSIVQIYQWERDAYKLVGDVVKSDNSEARRLAEGLIHYLGSLGFHSFRELLKSRV